MSPLVKQHIPAPARKTKTVVRRVHKSGITKGEKLLYGLAVPLIIAAAFMIVSNYASLYSLNYDAQGTEAAITEQTSVNDGLTLQVKELSDPDRILTIAQSELGMSLHDEQVRVLHQQN
ncbi:cell division protein FtsL [Alkalicoccus luteus]|uniref:Cell division protein FtsL n=1 Tax=Alkalicoccus luteus TaxID=1237094 RepID=A0A969PQA4_9BACI|nr:cell division protein FtsL [Alkalicoccus luteus]NJP36451.1 cell division protein FtsL [Alkalicoccus luteus]